MRLALEAARASEGERESGFLEEVREERPDMSEGEGEPRPAEPKLESKETSEPEDWEKEREWEMGEVARPVREVQCFNILAHHQSRGQTVTPFSLSKESSLLCCNRSRGKTSFSAEVSATNGSYILN